jgi:ATP-dependent DNA helicase RecQ
VRPLLTYFGEPMASACGHCDNCRTDHGARPRRLRTAISAPRAARSGGGPRTSTPYPLHSTVRHLKWGNGTVMGYDSDRMTVLFDDVGYKTLSVTVVQDKELLAEG